MRGAVELHTIAIATPQLPLEPFLIAIQQPILHVTKECPSESELLNGA
jgi:hypothetical protein